MEHPLTVRQTLLSNMGDVEKAATAMAKSGYFSDSGQQAQAIVKIIAGQEMGFGPFASMNGIHIIQGKPAIGANLMASAVRQSGKYNYRVIEMTDKVCSIDFYEGKEKIGNSSFTLEDGRKAGTKNLDRFPKNMLFARAMSNGVRWYTPDVFNGSAVYTPEELGANVNEGGNVIEAVVVENAKPEPVLYEARMSIDMANEVKTSDGKYYSEIDTETLTHMINSISKASKTATNGKLEEYKFKSDAIRTILVHRASQPVATNLFGEEQPELTVVTEEVQ